MKTQEQERYSAPEKCRAVLAAWTERKKASELCREMGVSAALFSQWQDRALSGILESLEPRGTKDGPEKPALPAQIRRLLERKSRALELEALGRNAGWRRAPKTRKPEASATGS